ncbi:MAG TPA: HAMP domain-containing sensor histidine kinase [Gemmatimonadaceae bacterium]|nr:HAMP domain-containing sensor histidine kinase [Gemmatimonadaceae bacterium]
MTLRARLTLGFLAIAALLLIPLGMSIDALRSVRETTAELERSDFSASLVLGQAIRALETAREKEQVYPLFPDSVARGPLLAAIDTLGIRADSLAIFGGELQPATDALREAVDSMRAAMPAYRAASLAENTAAMDSVSEQRMRPALARAEGRLQQIGLTLEGRARRLASDATKQVSRATDTALWALALVVLLAAGVAIQITHSISRPVRELERGLEAVADGDFDRPLGISATRDDEFGRLASSYHEMARRLAELDKLKAEFVSVASHELKTPINVILGYLQLLEEGLYGPLTPRQHEVVATLTAQGQGLARLVQQLLDVSRFEAGGGRIDPREVRLGAFVDELESAFRVLAHQREVRFTVLLGEGLPETVYWDADRMSEVVGNLLSNAFKFTERGGRVDLEVVRAAENVQLVVRDTGAGIPAEQLPHVFRKFYQADNQTAASLKGTGLGLAIAKEIVEAHGGQITVDSTPGVGTEFAIELPVRASRRHTGAHAPITVGAAR